MGPGRCFSKSVMTSRKFIGVGDGNEQVEAGLPFTCQA